MNKIDYQIKHYIIGGKKSVMTKSTNNASSKANALKTTNNSRGKLGMFPIISIVLMGASLISSIVTGILNINHASDNINLYENDSVKYNQSMNSNTIINMY